MMTAEQWQRWSRLGAVVVLGLAAGAAIRYLFFDTNTINWLCEGGRGPWWCNVRRGLKVVLQWQGLSLIAIGVALYAYATGRFRPVLLAAGLGAAGLFLYAPEISGAALLLAALRLVRPPATPETEPS